MNENFFHHRTRTDISKKAKDNHMAVVPLAATEQHGPYLPVYTDSIICEHIVSEAIEKASSSIPVLMTPVLSIGCSEHHLSFGGTLSLSSSTYLNVLREIGESLVASGFQKIVFINGHGGNANIMKQTANDLAVHHPIWTACASYWDIASNTLENVNAQEMGMVPGHAGGFEAALVLALEPKMMNMTRVIESHVKRKWINSGPAGTFIGKHGELTGYNGYTDIPTEATAEKGKIYLEKIVQSVAEWLILTDRLMDAEGENENEQNWKKG